jgi:hypothetical protein
METKNDPEFWRIERKIRDIIDEQSPNGESNVDYVLAAFVEAERKSAMLETLELLAPICSKTQKPFAGDDYKNFGKGLDEKCSDCAHYILCKKIAELKGAEKHEN